MHRWTVVYFLGILSVNSAPFSTALALLSEKGFLDAKCGPGIHASALHVQYLSGPGTVDKARISMREFLNGS